MKNSTVRLVPIALVLLMFFSCNKNGEVKQFMADFSTAIANKDRATIEKMYPDAAKADSLALDFDAENAQIETLDDGSIKVVLGEGKEISIIKNKGEEGLKIKDSHGVFAYPQDKMTFATKTGWYDKTLDDSHNADRLADTLFVSWVQASLVKIIDSSVKEKHISIYMNSEETDLCTYTVTVENNTDKEIRGNDYTISVKESWCEWEDGWADLSFKERKYPKSAKKTLTGKPIPAKGTATYTWSRRFEGGHHYGCCDYSIQSTLNYIPKTPYLSGSFTGKEYENYLKTKKNR